jgi:NAD-dependent DNA ligase
MSDGKQIDQGPGKQGPAIGDTIDEVQAAFASDAALQDAIAKLTHAGFDRADLSLPEARPAANQATPERGAAAPTTETDVSQARTLATSSAGAAGALAAAGATIATGGAAGLAIGAAAAAGLGTGALVRAAGNAAQEVQHEHREEAAERGELVLSVRTTDKSHREQAERLLKAAGASVVQPVSRRNAAVDSRSWTGG